MIAMCHSSCAHVYTIDDDDIYIYMCVYTHLPCTAVFVHACTAVFMHACTSLLTAVLHDQQLDHLILALQQEHDCVTVYCVALLL
jgi:hypothetical protein